MNQSETVNRGVWRGRADADDEVQAQSLALPWRAAWYLADADPAELNAPSQRRGARPSIGFTVALLASAAMALMAAALASLSR